MRERRLAPSRRAWTLAAAGFIAACQGTDGLTPVGGDPAAAGGITVEALETPGTGSVAQDVNSSAVAVGYASGQGCQGRTKGPALWTAAGAYVALPLPAGYCGGHAKVISETGYIGGYIWTGVDSPLVAARWVPGGSGYSVEDLGLGPNASYMEISALDDNGNGVAWNWGPVGGSGPPGRAYYWSPATGFVELASPAGASDVDARDLSATGGIPGAYLTPPSPVQMFGLYWASMSSAPIVLPLVDISYTSHSPSKINSAGTIVGNATLPQRRGTVYRVVQWTQVAGSWQGTTLATMGDESQARDIDDAGNVVGQSSTKGKWIATLWPGGGAPVSLGSLYSKGVSYTTAVAPTGRIAVGGSKSGTGGEYVATRWRF